MEKMAGTSGCGGGGGVAGGSGRSERERERSKVRERQRRAITTKIFQGLRKHGGYPLSPRADINEVLRYLASESGWFIEPDGTTYRSPDVLNYCPTCGTDKVSVKLAAAAAAPPPPAAATTTPSSSLVIGGGECYSTTSSPSRLPEFNTTTTVTVHPSLYSYEGQLSQLQEARASNTTTPVASPPHYHLP